MLNYYCDYCKKVWHIIAEAKGFDCCPDCLGVIQEVNSDHKPGSTTKSELKDKFANKFTNRERKAIFKEWRKHIEQIPTWYDVSPELAEKAYGKAWKSELHRMGCKVSGW